jgi:AbrB family looped-hinge helix DNA binding protein
MKKGPEAYGRFEMFGTTIAGERGQVVIPAAARKYFNIKKGEQFLVVSGGPHDDFIGLVPLRSLGKLVEKVKSLTQRLEKHVQKIKK